MSDYEDLRMTLKKGASSQMMKLVKIMCLGLILALSSCTGMRANVAADQDKDPGYSNVHSYEMGGMIASGDEYHPYPPYYHPED